MRVLVIGGMHGNEMLGIKLVSMLKEKPIKGVSTVIANERAVEAGSRFVRQDLNRSFPGEPGSQDYEMSRAAQLVKLCAGYDVVLDFHNTYCPDNDCSFVGQSAGRQLYNLSGTLGLKRVIVADYDCLNKYVPNCLSVEVSAGGKLDDPEGWYEKIASLGAKTGEVEVEKYRFVYRMTLQDRDRLGLDRYSLRAFQKLDPELAAKMGVKSPAYPIFINDKFTPYNYGGLLNKV